MMFQKVHLLQHLFFFQNVTLNKGNISLTGVVIMTGQATPPQRTTPRNKGLIAGLNKGNHWFIIRPYF